MAIINANVIKGRKTFTYYEVEHFVGLSRKEMVDETLTGYIKIRFDVTGFENKLDADDYFQGLVQKADIATDHKSITLDMLKTEYATMIGADTYASVYQQILALEGFETAEIEV